MEKSPVLAIVVPCYKEEAVLHETHKRLSLLLDKLIAERHISQHSYILYVNDGSTDQTWPIIKDLHQNTPYACGLNLAGNVGHQNALMAGLNAVKERCDVAVSASAISICAGWCLSSVTKPPVFTIIATSVLPESRNIHSRRC